jgi:ribosome-associated protein
VTFLSETIPIVAGLSIPVSELEFRVSRASGPGGQGVNTTDSRVELRFDLDASSALSDEQRQRLRSQLRGRIDAGGTLRVVAQNHRSQLLNRRDAIERFRALLAEALRPKTPRRPTRPSAAAVRRREAAKRHRTAIKQARRRPSPESD